MITAYRTVQGRLVETGDLSERGLWFHLVKPDEKDLGKVHTITGLDIDFLRAALDDEELPRVEIDEDQALIIIKIPTKVQGDADTPYDTIPLGIVVGKDNMVTVCLEKTEVLEEILNSSSRTYSTFKRTRMLLQILFKNASHFLRCLRDVDKRSDQIEAKLHRSTENRELIRLLGLEKSLVYFVTALRGNGIVLDKLLKILSRSHTQHEGFPLKAYEEDEDLLEDVITENRQALEVAEIHSSILTDLMDAFASVVSNNLNVIMKFLTSMTIVLALPTIVSSLYGMNIRLPLQDNPNAFGFVLGLSIGLSGLVAYILAKRDMF